MTGKSWEENPKYIPFNYVISHQKKIRRQSHKLLSRRHLNFPTFGVHLHKNICESAIFGKKEEKEQKKIFKTTCAICFPGLDYETHKETQYIAELRCSDGHGSHCKTYRSDYRLGIALSRLLLEECTFWQLLPSVAILRKHDSIMVLGSTSATTTLSEHGHLPYKQEMSFVGSINVFPFWKEYQ